jgi:hypothetical protein
MPYMAHHHLYRSFLLYNHYSCCLFPICTRLTSAVHVNSFVITINCRIKSVTIYIRSTTFIQYVIANYHLIHCHKVLERPG